MPEDQRDRPRDFADVCTVISELADELVAEEAEVRARQATDVGGRYPRRAFDSDGGGPTNRLHNFETGEDNPDDGSGIPVPQHSDPTGEAAVSDPFANDLARARRRAFECVCEAMREMEAARGALARTRKPEVTVEQKDRGNCWPCLEVGVRAEVLHDNAPNGVGRPKPRCRKHYEYFLSKLLEAPPELAVWWSEGRRVSSAMVTAAEQAEAVRRNPKKAKKGKKGKRR